VNKHISATIFRLDESISLSGIKPLNCPNTHIESPMAWGLGKPFNSNEKIVETGKPGWLATV
jgi:hypothetical protein